MTMTAAATAEVRATAEATASAGVSSVRTMAVQKEK